MNMKKEIKLKTTDVDAWLKSAEYLPDVMRDFHDQKDLFKAIHEIISENDGTKAISWRDAHIYTIDVFLWFMARRGYTLQRTRRRGNFRDLAADVQAKTEKRNAAFMAAMTQGMTPSNA